MLLALFYLNSGAQNIPSRLVTPLENTLSETSGLIIVNGRIITHNDSGGSPVLYEIDTSSGHVTRAVTLSDADNIDWEDLSRDDLYIYIGDFGNNTGTRKDLTIYRVRIKDYISAPNDQVFSEKIHFRYAGQNNFDPDPERTPFDAEALVSLNDSLYIFTKNHTGTRSDIYPVPKAPGTYILHKTDSISTGGLVTGGTYDGKSRRILLTGYNLGGAFILEITGTFPLSSATVNKMYLNTPGSRQVESIFPSGNGHYFITAEASAKYPAALLSLDPWIVTGEAPYNLPGLIFPNPATGIVNITLPLTYKVEIYALTGQKLLSGKAGILDVSSLRPGSYLVKINNAEEKISKSGILIIR